jgi:hypothetical protein
VTSEEALALAQRMEDFGECLRDDEAAACIRALVAERDAALALLEVPIRKIHYLCEDYPGDKESKAWLKRARAFTKGTK